MLPVLVLYACYELLSDYCIDEVPDTDSVFVYSVDRAFEELNRTYAKARGIVPEDETAFIDYEQIPELSTRMVLRIYTSTAIRLLRTSHTAFLIMRLLTLLFQLTRSSIMAARPGCFRCLA